MTIIGLYGQTNKLKNKDQLTLLLLTNNRLTDTGLLTNNRHSVPIMYFLGASSMDHYRVVWKQLNGQFNHVLYANNY